MFFKSFFQNIFFSVSCQDIISKIHLNVTLDEISFQHNSN